MVVMLEEGGERDCRAIKLATCKGRWIRNKRRIEWPAEKTRAAVTWDREGHPNATLRSSTAVYNCMGLVFASRRTWVFVDQLEIIIKDDGFVKLSNINEVNTGDIVLYKHNGEVAHVGIVTHVGSIIPSGRPVVTVLSKWGGHGEYVHSVNDVPEEFGEEKEYWTERKEKP